MIGLTVKLNTLPDIILTRWLHLYDRRQYSCLATGAQEHNCQWVCRWIHL